MAKPKKGAAKVAQQPQHSDWMSGTLPQRVAWTMFERISRGTGAKIGQSEMVKNFLASLSSFTGLNPAIAGMMTEMLTNVRGPATWLANEFGIPVEATVDVANEGLDEITRGMFDAASGIDPKLPLDQQNNLLRKAADEQFKAYGEKFRKANPEMFEEVILADEYSTKQVHELKCPYLRPLLDKGAQGVTKVWRHELPDDAMAAVCKCQQGTVGTLMQVFAAMRKTKLAPLPTVVKDELALPEYDDVRNEFWALASKTKGVSVDMVEEAVMADPPTRRALMLGLVGLQPKHNLQTGADTALKKAKQIAGDLLNPDSKIRKEIDPHVHKIAADMARYGAAARRRS